MRLAVQLKCNAVKRLDSLTLIPSQNPSYLLQVPATCVNKYNYIFGDT